MTDFVSVCVCGSWDQAVNMIMDVKLMPNWCLIEVQMVKNPQCVLNTMYFLPKGWTLVWERNNDSMYWWYKLPVSSYKKQLCIYMVCVHWVWYTEFLPTLTLNGTHSAKDLCGYLWKSFLLLKYSKYTKICLLRVLCLPISPALWMVVCLWMVSNVPLYHGIFWCVAYVMFRMDIRFGISYWFSMWSTA